MIAKLVTLTSVLNVNCLILVKCEILFYVLFMNYVMSLFHRESECVWLFAS